ncbi:MAG: GNAT family N-acetyltransferase [Candidatus Diapherotrites archaeon]|nr:GNAT family N-acetyltransferase [Candidatus Diapherotrites archaeon]
MCIRRFKPQDSVRVSEIAVQGVVDDELLSNRSKKWLKKNEFSNSYLGKSKKFEIFVFEENHKIQGLVGLDKNEIRCLYVAREKRLQGIGAQLLSFIENQAKKKGYQKTFTYSAYSAQDFYKKHGYSQVAIKFNQKAGFYTVEMGKELNDS